MCTTCCGSDAGRCVRAGAESGTRGTLCLEYRGYVVDVQNLGMESSTHRKTVSGSRCSLIGRQTLDGCDGARMLEGDAHLSCQGPLHIYRVKDLDSVAASNHGTRDHYCRDDNREPPGHPGMDEDQLRINRHNRFATPSEGNITVRGHPCTKLRPTKGVATLMDTVGNSVPLTGAPASHDARPLRRTKPLVYATLRREDELFLLWQRKVRTETPGTCLRYSCTTCVCML